MLKYYYDSIRWYDDYFSTKTFRSNGPSVIYEDGTVIFSQLTSSVSRVIGPAVIQKDGTVDFTNREGNYHRTDGPAYIHHDGKKEYWVDSKQMSADEFFFKIRSDIISITH